LPPNVTIIAKDSNQEANQGRSVIPHQFDNRDNIHRRSFFPSVASHHRTFNDCTFISNIATTQHATVDRYHDPSRKIDIAIKTYHIETSGNEPPNDFAWREIELLSKLNHPCIIEFEGFSLGNANEGLKIATIYAEGGLLKEVLHSNPIWWNCTAKSLTIVGIVMGMRYLHSKGILHRDLKPSNILMNGRDHKVQICDFHVSRLKTIEKTFTGMVGTVQYMAPEIYRMSCDSEGGFSPDPTEKMDVFSFGLILYEIIVGQKVFPDNLDLANVMYRVLNEKRAEIPGWIPAFVFQLISKCWDDDPENRPTFKEIFEVLRMNEFKISHECDSTVIESYVERIECKERENAARPQTFFDLPDVSD
jgi:serine/threonine protein kinase